MARVLLIEDDVRLAAMVADYLRPAGLDAAHAATGSAGLAELQRGAFDLVLLDLMLPDGDGLDVFRRIRALRGASAQTPVIMLTARGDPLDKVVGLEIGAEDYVAKPFEPRELLARIRVVLRRGQAGAASSARRSCVSAVSKSIPRRAPCASTASIGRRRAASSTFSSRWPSAPGACCRANNSPNSSGGEAQAYDPALDRSIDVHIARLRSLIEDDPKSPRRIITVRGAGYVFARVAGRGAAREQARGALVMRRLYLRIYLAVLASVVLSVLLAGLAWRVFGDSERLPNQAFFREAATTILPPAGAGPQAQREALQRWSALSGFDLALLDPSGRIVAAAGERAMAMVASPAGPRWGPFAPMASVFPTGARLSPRARLLRAGRRAFSGASISSARWRSRRSLSRCARGPSCDG